MSNQQDGAPASFGKQSAGSNIRAQPATIQAKRKHETLVVTFKDNRQAKSQVKPSTLVRSEPNSPAKSKIMLPSSLKAPQSRRGGLQKSVSQAAIKQRSSDSELFKSLQRSQSHTLGSRPPLSYERHVTPESSYIIGVETPGTPGWVGGINLGTPRLIIGREIQASAESRAGSSEVEASTESSDDEQLDTSMQSPKTKEGRTFEIKALNHGKCVLQMQTIISQYRKLLNDFDQAEIQRAATVFAKHGGDDSRIGQFLDFLVKN